MKKLWVNNFGQSLVETIMAVSLIVMVLVALVSLVTYSLANAQFAKNKMLANKYGQETIEWLRTERDNDWVTFYGRAVPGNNIYCFIVNDNLISWLNTGMCTTTEVIAGTTLRRTVTLTRSGTQKILINVLIEWSQGNKTSSVSLDSFLNNWQ